jgi:hypothetical protein
MRLLESIAFHLLVAFLILIVCGPLLLMIIVGVLPKGMAFEDRWLWFVWGVISLVMAYFIPGAIARNRLNYWLRRLASPGRRFGWEPSSCNTLSWLDSALLWPWERSRLAPVALRNIEPYLRSEMPAAEAHRRLLKLLFGYSDSDPEYRRLLMESYLTRGISDVDDTKVISELWDEEHPNQRLGAMWVDFALAQRIDAPWMEKGYLWAVERGGEAADKVVRFLLTRLVSRQRFDDLAAVVYLRGAEVEPTPELDRALLRVARYHYQTARADALAQRVKKAVAGIQESLAEPDTYREVDVDALIAEVKPSFGGFLWRYVKTGFSKLLPAIAGVMGCLFKGLWNALTWVKLPVDVAKYRVPAAIGVFVVIVVWAVVQVVPLPMRGPGSGQEGLAPLVYHSDLPFTVQVAAFRELGQAEQMVLHLRRNNEEAYWQKTDGENPWYRVRVGGFATLETARKYAENMIERQLIDNYYIANFADGYYRNP